MRAEPKVGLRAGFLTATGGWLVAGRVRGAIEVRAPVAGSRDGFLSR
ncbi:MAG: hypothetical protein KatS3mg007_0461 [Thermoanaerobaculum sp.]|nr:MAG: hypothetical protein KatS3mg007_0461 [Thermoanaerobaculum sp.]